MIYFLKTFKIAVSLFIGLFVLWQFWVFLAPRPDPLQPSETAAVRDAVHQLVANLQQAHGTSPTTFGIVPLSNDPTGTATAELQQALAAQPAWSVEQSSVIQRILSDIASAIANASSVEEVLQAGRKVDLDAIAFGRLGNPKVLPDGTTVSLNLQVRDLQSGQWILRDSVTGTWQPSVVDHLRQPLPFWMRAAFWALGVAALPWLTPFLTRWAVARQSNFASAALLLAYTLTALLLAAVLLGFSLSGTLSWLLLLLALLLAATYSFFACEYIAARSP